MQFKNSEEYHRAVEKFVKMRRDKNSPVLELEEMYDSFVEYEYNVAQDVALNEWLDNRLNDARFSDSFLNTEILKNYAINFLETKIIPFAEKVVDGKVIPRN